MNDKTIYLIPGFMSPAWMLVPFQRYLSLTFPDVNRWDYPRVFTDLDATICELAAKLDGHASGSVMIVAHSFGDWIVRSALARTKNSAVSALLSVCPVVTSVTAAKFARQVTGDWIPELSVMSDKQRSEITIPADVSIKRSFIWARAEWLIARGNSIPTGAREQTVLASHNSILFQPNAWKVIRQELKFLSEDA